MCIRIARNHLTSCLPNLHVQLWKLWIYKSDSSRTVKCFKICPSTLSCSSVMTCWTWMSIKNLALLPVTQKAKCPSVWAELLIGPQGWYHKHKEMFCFFFSNWFFSSWFFAHKLKTLNRKKSKNQRGLSSVEKKGNI